MNQSDLIFLKDLYNALRTITTSDRNTITMGKCLEALGEFVIEKNAELQRQQCEVVEKEEE